jgi:hypothetical protein
MRFYVRENRKFIIAGSVISVLLLSCLIYLYIPRTPPKLRITGSEPYVYHESGLVVVVTKEKYRKKFNDALNTDSTFGIMLQLLMGRIFDVENNTKVEILDKGIYATKVKVLEGEYASKVGWVPDEWIKHSK